MLQPDSAPVHSAPYQDGFKTREFEEAEIDRRLSDNIDELTQAEQVAATAFVPNKDQALHSYIGYRKLKAGIKRDSYFIAHMNECIGLLGYATVSSLLDDNTDYEQIGVKYFDKRKGRRRVAKRLILHYPDAHWFLKYLGPFQRTIDVFRSSTKSTFFTCLPKLHCDHHRDT